MEDLQFILGPNMNHMSRDSDFDPASSRYDTQQPIQNLIRMFQRCQAKEEKAEKEKQAKEAELRSEREQ